jgi:hypothetical protein
MWAERTIIVDIQAERQKVRHFIESYTRKSDKQLKQETTAGCFVILSSPIALIKSTDIGNACVSCNGSSRTLERSF